MYLSISIRANTGMKDCYQILSILNSRFEIMYNNGYDNQQNSNENKWKLFRILGAWGRKKTLTIISVHSLTKLLLKIHCVGCNYLKTPSLPLDFQVYIRMYSSCQVPVAIVQVIIFTLSCFFLC